MEQQRRLYRSQTNRIIAGICGGLSEYLDIDVTIIRLIWIVLTLLGGSGILIYIIAYFIIPLKPSEPGSKVQSIKADSTLIRIMGILLVFLGLIILLDKLEVFSFDYWWDLTSDYILPSILIILGIYLLTKRSKMTGVAPIDVKTEDKFSQNQMQEENKEEVKRKKLYRSLTNKKIFGICGGFGEYFDVDPTIIRIIYVLFTLMSGGIGFILYIILYLIIPEKKLEQVKQG